MRAGVVAVGERRLQQIFGQAVQLARRIDHVRGYDVDHLFLCLHAPAHLDQPGAHHHLAVFLERIGPDDEIGDPGFVFQANKDETFCSPRSLTANDVSRDAYGGTVFRLRATPTRALCAP